MFYKLITNLARAAMYHHVHQGEVMFTYCGYHSGNLFGVKGKLVLNRKYSKRMTYCGLYTV